MAKLYECRNKDCELGTKDQPGQFSDNKGVCPNCGKKGKAK